MTEINGYNRRMHDSAAPGGQIQVIDSHTAGEPTRVVIASGPPLGEGDPVAQLTAFRTQHDRAIPFVRAFCFD